MTIKKTSPELMVYSFRAMGSPCTFRFFADSVWEGEVAAELAMDEVRRIEAKYSLFSQDSFLWSINRHASRGLPIQLDIETSKLFEFALVCFQKSNGLFDISAGILRGAYDFSNHRQRKDIDVTSLLKTTGLDKLRWDPPQLEFPVEGMQLDFGGLAKEYAVDRAAILFQDNGIQSCLVDLGGDMVAVGPPADAPAWSIRIRDPRSQDEYLASVQLARGALATSGDYENYIVLNGVRQSHIINPKTGLPTVGLASVSALAVNCMAAGAATTIAMLLGESGLDWLGGQTVPFCALKSDGKIIHNFPKDVYQTSQI